MKKILFFLICSIFFIANVNASIDEFPDSYKTKLLELKEKYPNWEFVPYKGINNRGIINGSGINFRTGPGTSYSIISSLGSNTVFELISYHFSGSGCNDQWIKIKINSTEGYICSSFAYTSTTKFQDIVNVQSSNRSLVHTSFGEAYRSIEPGDYNIYNNTWIGKDGSTWVAANSDVVAYFLDPRNFLNETNIFMFEHLRYNENHSVELIQSILKPTFMSGTYLKDGVAKSYASTFLEAGIASNVSPIHLASRVRQEQGVNGSAAITGNAFTYSVLKSDHNIRCSSVSYNSNLCTDVTYSGLYNFFNWGATSSSSSNINPNWKNGLIYANGGLDGSYKTFSRPWNNIYSSILGGTQALSNNYISRGQDTLYFQKFNVVAEPYYSNQYMTNIMAPRSESSMIYSSYSNLDILDFPFTFLIPVYEDMPESTSLPKTGNPNNYLKNIKINDKDVIGFNPLINEYTVYVSNIVDKVNISVEKMISSSSVYNINEVNIVGDTYKHEILVKSENENERRYIINFIKSADENFTIEDVIAKNNFIISNGILKNITLDTSISSFQSDFNKYDFSMTVVVKDSNNNVKTTDKLFTGDKVSITLNGQTKEYSIIVKGDVVGDGKVSVLDLLRTQRILLNSVTLSDLYLKAGDVNNDGNVSVLDLLIIQKHILGVSTIN